MMGCYEHEAAFLAANPPIEITRSWWERLFSLPWRPWRKTRTYDPFAPRRLAFLWRGVQRDLAEGFQFKVEEFEAVPSCRAPEPCLDCDGCPACETGCLADCTCDEPCSE